MLKFDQIRYITEDGRLITLSEPDDHVLQLEIEGQIIARFTQTGVTIDNILKQVKNQGIRHEAN